MSKARLLIQKYEYARRHLRTGLRRLTPAKAANMARNGLELRRKQPILSTRPFYIKIEPTPYCHLRCPGCQHGSDPKVNKEYTKDSRLSLSDFQRIIDPLKDSLLGVSLSVRGEPLMNPDTPAMVEYCHKNNIGTSFPSNFSMKLSEGQMENLVVGGLDHIMVAVDGITQDVYGRYRVGGRLDLVMENLTNLVNIKRRLRSKTPLVEFKFIVFDHNRHELEAAEKLAKDLGCDRFSVVLANETEGLDDKFDKLRARNQSKQKACFWPWNNAVIMYDGTVSACCIRTVVMGNVLQEGFTSLWNNENYRSIRRFFSPELVTEEDKGRWFCENCRLF